MFEIAPICLKSPPFVCICHSPGLGWLAASAVGGRVVTSKKNVIIVKFFSFSYFDF